MARIVSLEKAKNSGVVRGDYVRLVNPLTSFHDRMTGWGISGHEVKALPDVLSPSVMQSIRGGRFVFVGKKEYKELEKDKGE